MFKNTAGQYLTLSVFDSATGLQKTGDAANLTFYVDKDDAGPVAIASNSGVPTEISSTNAKGDYKIALAQGETNADKTHYTGKSSTSGIVVVSKTIYTVPANFTSATLANLDAAITSRMATYTQPTGFLAATFPTTVASTTNITAATGITVSTNSDKTGYSLTQAFPANFADLSIIASTGRVDLGKWVGGNPASLNGGRVQCFVAAINSGAIDTPAFAAGATIPRVTLADTLTTYTGDTPQTGDSFARLGTPAGASVSADVAAVKAETAAIVDDTGTSGVVLTAAERNAVADALLARNVAGGSSTGRLVKEALYSLRNKVTVSGGTLSVYDVLDTTVVWSAAVTTAAGDPVVTMDPG